MRHVKETLRVLSEFGKFTFGFMNFCVVTYAFAHTVMPIILTNLNLVYNATTLLLTQAVLFFTYRIVR